MRVIIVGASDLGLDLSRKLIKKGDEVILIEKDPDKAKKLAETLDCTVISAEGTRPDTLEKAEITEAAALVACVDSDQNNILIGLIARGYNVPKVIVQTNDAQFQEVAKKLGFRHVINLSQIASVIISDTLREINTIELSSLVRGDVRFLEIIVDERFENKKLAELELPDKSACIGLYRKNEFILYRKDPALKVGDGLVIVTSTEYIEKIYSQFAPQGVNSQLQ
jgi:trk system potassium uptake protein TrkA